ncbi:MFS transporter [Plantactinospora sp. CA-290183]|uniref:MFS transporter n=1 Tax=Plantactinospora sp. CA-290183 TaxID=3240006 RepID=UPI003D8A9CA6
MELTHNTGHPRRWAILGVLVVSLLVIVLDNTVLNVALRTLADPVHGLGATQGQLEWSINSYTLVFAGLLFTFGVLGDRWGRKWFLQAGLALFGLASLLSAYAQSPGQLIGARALMGIGAAAVMPVTLSIISNVFDPRERGRAIGVWAGAVGLGVAIGPVLGGLLLENYWWGSVFLINVPVVLIGMVAAALLVPNSRDPKPGRIDVVGVLLSVVGLVLLSYGIIDGGEHGFGRPLVWASIVGGLVVLAAFVAWERRVAYPSLDVRLFRVPQFAAPVAVIGLVFFAAMGVMFFSAFYLQLVRGYSPLQTGLLMLPFAAAQLVFAPRSAAMVKRYGGRTVAVVGLVLTAGALGAFAFATADTPIWIIGVIFFAQGVGMANIMPPATESIMSALPREKAGVGSAVSNTVRQVAGALGVAVLGSVLSGVYRDQIAPAAEALPAPARDAATESVSGAYAVAERLGPAGQAVISAANDAFVSAMHWAAGLSAIFAALGIVVVLRWLPGRPVEEPARPPEPAVDPELAVVS